MRRFLLALFRALPWQPLRSCWLRNRDRRELYQSWGRDRELASDGSNRLDSSTITRRFLLYFIVPLWQMAGIADWICHRATNIEGTTGAKESLMHLLMLAEVSIPVLAGFYLEITAPVAALMILAFVLHDATALWDVSYAVTRREVTPIEQHVHSFLEMVPLMAISFIAVLHWPQFSALFESVGSPQIWRSASRMSLCRPITFRRHSAPCSSSRCCLTLRNSLGHWLRETAG